MSTPLESDTNSCYLVDCKATFTSQEERRKHFKEQHPSLYQCSICLACYGDKQQIFTHFKVHEAERLKEDLGDGGAVDKKN